jgi:hypothetical protein
MEIVSRGLSANLRLTRVLGCVQIMNKLPKGIIFLIGCLIFSFFATIPSYAADSVSSVGIATYTEVSDKIVQNGDIIVGTSQGYTLSKQAYDTRVTGVVTTRPAVELRDTDQTKGYPVVSRGSAFVKVTDENGPIKEGDFIATSSITGVGMKSTRSGYVVGEALQAANFSGGKNVVLVPIRLNLRFVQIGSQTQSQFSDIFSMSQIAAYEQPIRVIQYIIAAIIVISSFGFGFLIFARAVNTGIQALGRNPLAGRMIQISIVFNLILIIIIIMTGVSLAYLVIRLT